MLEALKDYDWEAAFSFVTGTHEGGSSQCGRPEWAEGSGMTGTSEPFGRDDVAEIIASSPGENDGAEWLMFGKLKDGRFFFLAAGCDYTGWDCVGTSGRSFVATERGSLETYIISLEERTRLGLSADTPSKEQP